MRKFNINLGGRGDAKVIFSQSLFQSDLIYHLYSLFKDYCDFPPKQRTSLIKAVFKVIRLDITYHLLLEIYHVLMNCIHYFMLIEKSDTFKYK